MPGCQNLIIFIIVAFVSVATSTSGYHCNGNANYSYPVKKDCMSFYICFQGSTRPLRGNCFLLFAQLFNPETLHCDFPWNVDCAAVPSDPPDYPAFQTTTTVRSQPTKPITHQATTTIVPTKISTASTQHISPTTSATTKIPTTTTVVTPESPLTSEKPTTTKATVKSSISPISITKDVTNKIPTTEIPITKLPTTVLGISANSSSNKIPVVTPKVIDNVQGATIPTPKRAIKS